jgi:hypothetical protein
MEATRKLYAANKTSRAWKIFRCWPVQEMRGLTTLLLGTAGPLTGLYLNQISYLQISLLAATSWGSRAWLTLHPWRWKQYIPEKRPLNFYRIIWHDILENSTLYCQACENLKSNKMSHSWISLIRKICSWGNVSSSPQNMDWTSGSWVRGRQTKHTQSAFLLIGLRTY